MQLIIFVHTDNGGVEALLFAIKQLIITALCRGALMHGLQGAEAQGPTLERGPTGCREILFFE